MNLRLPIGSERTEEVVLRPTSPIHGKTLHVATAIPDTLWLCKDGYESDDDRVVMALPIVDGPAVAIAILEAVGHDAAAALVREELEAE